MKNIYFYSIIIGFFLGVGIASFFVVNNLFLTNTLFVCIGILFFLWIKRQNLASNVLTIIIAFILCMFFGFLCFNLKETSLEKNNLDRFQEKDIVVAGSVLASPKIKPESIETYFYIKSILADGEVLKIPNQKIIVSLPTDTETVYGDNFLLSGQLKKIKNFDSDKSERSFDYVSFMKKDGILYRMDFPEIKKVDINSGKYLIKILGNIKEKFVSNIQNTLGEPSSSLVSGMTIAGRGGISSELEDIFVRAGIIHIVVLSGFNLAIVAIFGNFIFNFFRKQIRSVLIITLIFLFILMAGISPPLIRAGIMAIIMIFARSHNRKLDPLKLLFFAGFIMVLINPYVLVFDPSFILSFLATFGVIFVSDFLELKMNFVTNKLKLRRMMAETLGASIFVYPYIAYTFGNLSLVSLPVNMLVLPLIPPIMLLGLVIGASGSIGIIANFFAIIVDILIRYIIFVCESFLRLPYAFLEVRAFSFYYCCVIYLIVFLFFYNKKKKMQKKVQFISEN